MSILRWLRAHPPCAQSPSPPLLPPLLTFLSNPFEPSYLEYTRSASSLQSPTIPIMSRSLVPRPSIIKRSRNVIVCSRIRHGYCLKSIPKVAQIPHCSRSESTSRKEKGCHLFSVSSCCHISSILSSSTPPPPPPHTRQRLHCKSSSYSKLEASQGMAIRSA